MGTRSYQMQSKRVGHGSQRERNKMETKMPAHPTPKSGLLSDPWSEIVSVPYSTSFARLFIE